MLPQGEIATTDSAIVAPITRPLIPQHEIAKPLGPVEPELVPDLNAAYGAPPQDFGQRQMAPDPDALTRQWLQDEYGNSKDPQTQAMMGEELAKIATPAITPVRSTQSEIDAIQTKDYSIKKDPDGNVIHRGKDRDAKWSIKDKIGSTLLGILKGAAGGPLGMLAGGIQAGTDRNYLEKQEDAQQLQQLYPRLKQQREAEDFERDQKYKQSQIDINAIKPDIMQQQADTTAFRAVSQARYNDLRMKLGQQKADDWRWAQEQLQDFRQGKLKLDAEKVKLLERRIAEIETNNVRLDEDRDATRKIGERKVGVMEGRESRLGKIKADAGKNPAAAKTKALTSFVNAYQRRNKGALPSQEEKDAYLSAIGLQ